MLPLHALLRRAFKSRLLRRNARVLLRYLALVATVVAIHASLFQLLMRRVDGQSHSWISGLYWVMSTMSTLGLGDITFQSDLGRLFTIAVTLSGVLMFFLVLPFLFIQLLYAPWMEVVRVPARVRGHVLITSGGDIATELAEKLELHGIASFILEPEESAAAALRAKGLQVVGVTNDASHAYEQLHAGEAALVLANDNDMANANITLTVREVAPAVPIVALIEDARAEPVLRAAGATQVFVLKQILGEHLANRMNAGHAQAHVIGSFRGLIVAEFPAHNTPLVGHTLRELRLRETLGLNVIGIFDQTRFHAVGPDTRLTEHSVPVVVGSQQQIDALDEFLVIYDANYSPVLIIGGGKVGGAAARLLQRRGVPVHVIDRQELGSEWADNPPDRFFRGDASDSAVLMAAGLHEAPGVMLTTSDDAMNIYLALYCRRLAPNTRIVSRVTHERNVESIRRAGADVALSHTSLGVESVFATLHGYELLVLGEGIELHELAVPGALVGKSLAHAGIAEHTGLNVVAVRTPTAMLTNPRGETELAADSTLLVIGNRAQLRDFARRYA